MILVNFYPFLWSCCWQCYFNYILNRSISNFNGNKNQLGCLFKNADSNLACVCFLLSSYLISFFWLEFYFHPYIFNFNFPFVLLIHTCFTSFLPVFMLIIIILNSLSGSSNNWAISKSRSVFSIVLVHIETQAMSKSLGLFSLMVGVARESGPKLVPFHFSPVRSTLRLLLPASVGLDALIGVQPMYFPFHGSLKLLSHKNNNPGGLFARLYAFPEVMTTPTLLSGTTDGRFIQFPHHLHSFSWTFTNVLWRRACNWVKNYCVQVRRILYWYLNPHSTFNNSLPI